MAWFRAHEGITSDTKWHIVARKAKVNVGTVVAIWVALLDHASQNEERGSLEGFDCEAIDALFGYEDGVCERVLDAMEGKGLVENGRVVNWSKRQPAREDGSSTERVREYRSRQKAQTGQPIAQTQETQCNAVKRDETQCNAVKRDETPQIREDKIREEIKREEIPPYIPPEGGNAESHSPAQSPRGKKERRGSGNSLPALRAMMAEWTQNPVLLDKLEAWRAMRERIRKPLTCEALRLAFLKLDEMAPDDAGKIAILEQSIFNSWQGLFQLKDTAESTGRLQGGTRILSFEEMEAARVAKIKEAARLYDEARERGEAV